MCINIICYFYSNMNKKLNRKNLMSATQFIRLQKKISAFLLLRETAFPSLLEYIN